jgi:hypothetical protein
MQPRYGLKVENHQKSQNRCNKCIGSLLYYKPGITVYYKPGIKQKSEKTSVIMSFESHKGEEKRHIRLVSGNLIEIGAVRGFKVRLQTGGL